MTKVFISQPMKGKTDEEILAVREKAIKAAAEKANLESQLQGEIFVV